MPLIHCNSCHHEWESARCPDYWCDWCGATGRVIQELTDFERFLKEDRYEKIMRKLSEKDIRQCPRCFKHTLHFAGTKTVKGYPEFVCGFCDYSFTQGETGGPYAGLINLLRGKDSSA